MNPDSSTMTQPRPPGPAGAPAAGGGLLAYAAASDVGLLRSHNEDSCLSDAVAGLWLVADGMGGHGGGDVASEIATGRVADTVRRGAALVDAIHEAHAAIIDVAARGKGTERMGSTIVALRTHADEYEIAWVGDSRAYLWDGALRPLTRDHSLVQEYLDRNLITAEAAATDSRRGVITRCLGPANTEDLVVDTLRGRWHRGERILLSSDGLHEVIGDAAIAAILADNASSGDAVNRLVGAALQASGPDNITVVIVDAPADAPAAIAAAPESAIRDDHEPPTRSRSALAVAVITIALLLTAALGIVWNRLG